MLAMTIFAIMSTMILWVYFNITNTSRKLNATRQLSETAREITERLTQDIRIEGISLSGSKYDDGTTYKPWIAPSYTQSGGEILGIGTETTVKRIYVYGKKVTSGPSVTLDHCTQVDKLDTSLNHCGLYMVEGYNWANAYNLVDSFIPEESKKRVKIEDLKFYISWDDNTAKKVVVNFTLGLMPRIGVPPSMAQTTKLHIQTTISERIFKTY